MERSILKRRAKDQLKGKWGLAIGSFFVAQLIISVISGSSSLVKDEFETLPILTEIISLLLTGVMTYGMSKFSLNMAINKDKAQFSDIFSGFSIFLKTLGIFLLMTLAVVLGMILLIIPGIIISLMFSQAFYVLCDDNDKGVIESLKESSRIMKGHKWEYFVLTLSFLGWWIGVIFTLGIGALWLVPYQEVTLANYYLELKGEQDYYKDNNIVY